MSEITPPLPRIEPEPSHVEVYFGPSPRKQRYWLHLLLLGLTFCTTMLVGTQLEMNYLHARPIFTVGDDWLPWFPLHAVSAQPSLLWHGLPFSLTLMIILLSHEMGHYVMCLRYGVYATMPYFIPAPTLIGTMGAFIRIKSPIRSRTALFDIGIAGPIAGFVVATFVLLFSLTLSKPGPPTIVEGDYVIGYPLIFQLLHWFMIGDAVRVMPLSGMLLHPTAIAAWVGMFATSLNLLPGGQLDGGHIVYSLFPRAHKWVTIITIGILIPMVTLSLSWIIWAALIWLSGLSHPAVPTWPDLPRSRRLIAWSAPLMLVLTFIPMPFQNTGLFSHWR